jgi:hypothetical protein
LDGKIGRNIRSRTGICYTKHEDMKINLRVLVFVVAAIYSLSAGIYRAMHFSKDFIPVYGGARCLLHGCNPYDPSALEHEYLQAGGNANLLGADFWRAYIPVYPPSTFLVLSPLALFPFPIVKPLWALINGGLFVAAAGVVLFASPPRYQWLSTILVSLFLVVKVNTSLLAQGNPTPFAIALLILGTVLFVRGRSIPVATVALMLSLAVKPQMGGLIALYLLFKKIHWRPVLVAMAGAVAILLIAGLILQAHPGSHEWGPALRANVAKSVQPGQINDPRPENTGALGIVNLQTITSVFFADAKIFNAVAFGIFAVMLAMWIAAALRAAPGSDDHFLLIAALAVLSLLPVYHRSGDDLLLLLTVPAIILILEKRRALGILLAIMTAMVCIAEFDDALRSHFVEDRWGWSGILQHKILFIVLLREQCPLLLLLFGLYAAAFFAVPARTEQRYLHGAVPVN